MSVLKINKNNFDSYKNGAKPLLLDFYADWCGPCRIVSPIIEEIANDRPDVAVGKVNVDSEPELAAAFGVYSIPTLVVLKNGRISARVTGARPRESIEELLNG